MNEMNQPFFERLNQLGNGDRAALRRAAGIPLTEADGNALMAFYRCLPANVPEQQADWWFAVACLRCLWASGPEPQLPLEQLFSRLLQEEVLSESIQHRITTLLDLRWSSDGYLLSKLSRLVKLLRQKTGECPFDFGALLEDLLRWNWESQIVQRKWARSLTGNTIQDGEGE